MEFWGIEVKPGQTVKCEPGDDKVLHLSQASLGETKKEKGSENVPIFVNINSQKLVLGTLFTEKCPQIQYDLVFEKEFQLSHGSKNSSVFFVGYKSIYQGYESEEDFSDSDSDEDLLAAKKVKGLGNPSKAPPGKVTADKEASVKAENTSAKLKSKAEIKEPIKDDKSKKVKNKDDEASDDDDDDEDDDSFAEESDEDEEMVQAPGGNSSNEDDDDDESSEEEDTPKKVENATKRKIDSSKTPVPEKKAKLVSPAGNHKTGGDGKKVIHVATPHPAKQGGKPQQTPKSGAVACKSCNRTFATENALQAHNKAKHGAAAK